MLDNITREELISLCDDNPRDAFVFLLYEADRRVSYGDICKILGITGGRVRQLHDRFTTNVHKTRKKLYMKRNPVMPSTFDLRIPKTELEA